LHPRGPGEVLLHVLRRRGPWHGRLLRKVSASAGSRERAAARRTPRGGRMSPISHRNLLGMEPQRVLVEAQEAYVKKMNELFPVGSHWLCFVGSPRGYEVEIVWNDFEGIQVKNVDGKGKTRRVAWPSLG